MSQTPPAGPPTSSERHTPTHAPATTSERIPSELACFTLEHALPELEWEQDVLETAHAYRNGDLRPISAEELDQILGLSDTPADMSILDDIE